jgi:hypothetical protein
MAATIPTNRVRGGTSRNGQPPFLWIFPANPGEHRNFIRSGLIGLCICRLRGRRLLKRNTRTILAGGLLAVGTFAFAQAGQFEAGEAAYFEHDYANAIRLLRPLAVAETPRRGIGSHQYISGAAMACSRMPRRRPYGIARRQTKGTPWRRLTLA